MANFSAGPGAVSGIDFTNFDLSDFIDGTVQNATPTVIRVGFSANDYTGATVPLSAYRGKVVLLNFWQTNCAPCKVEMPSMEALQKHFPPDEFLVVTLASEAGFDPVRAFFPQGTKLTVLLDPPEADNVVGKISKSWGTDKWPESYLIDRKGNVRYYVVNSRDWSSPDAVDCARALVSE